MANLDFRKDLKLGNEGEVVVTDFLESKGHKYVDSNNDNKYDVKMITNGKETTYEIKTDVKCAPLFDTGNIFIEFESRGKASGIAVTQAKWFVTYFRYLNELWFIKSNDLRTLIENNEFQVFYDAGDVGSATHGYLINRKQFKKHFNVCKI
jgi:hypothetical protein